MWMIEKGCTICHGPKPTHAPPAPGSLQGAIVDRSESPVRAIAIAQVQRKRLYTSAKLGHLSWPLASP